MTTFNGNMTSFPEGAMKYYRQLAWRGMECNKFDVPYPLPRELVMRGQDVERDRRRQFVLDSCSFMSEFCRDRNPGVGAVQRDQQGLERCDDWLGGSSGSEDTSQEQFGGFRSGPPSSHGYFSLLLATFGSVLFCRKDG
jgi:hypothetical protein